MALQQVDQPQQEPKDIYGQAISACVTNEIRHIKNINQFVTVSQTPKARSLGGTPGNTDQSAHLKPCASGTLPMPHD